MIKGLSIIICTRNRIEDLKKCIISISKSKINHIVIPIELIIIDDGEISPTEISFFKRLLSPSIELIYEKKNEPGLFMSRIRSIEVANYDILLFLDDDIEITDNYYLEKLIKTYLSYPNVVGVGGVDNSIKASLKWKLFTRLIQYSSGRTGKLSISSYGGSMHYWPTSKEIFQTEFLHGCNMSFKKDALENLEIVDWLSSYSLGEDIYLSQYAMKKGPLIINPELRVDHHHSPTSRDKLELVSYTEVTNHYYLLNYMGARRISYLAQIWTTFGLYLLSIIKNSNSAKGYRKGVIFLLSNLLNKKKERI